MQRRPIYLFSGLGGDERLLDPQRASGLTIHTPPWLEPEDGESLEAYARRWAPTLDVPDGAILGGVSFGGMIACEMTRYFKPSQLVLISSCRDNSALPRLYIKAETWFRGLPDDWIRKPIVSLHPLVHRVLGDITPEQQRFLMSMFEVTPMRRLRAFMRMACGWGGAGPIETPVSHIHGDRDPVIPSKRAKPMTIVPGAGHLMSITHPEPVSELLWSLAR